MSKTTKMSRTAAATKAWVTIRAKQITRSQAARKAWATRRAR